MWKFVENKQNFYWKMLMINRNCNIKEIFHLKIFFNVLLDDDDDFAAMLMILMMAVIVMILFNKNFIKVSSFSILRRYP